jgi:hypothetical protein
MFAYLCPQCGLIDSPHAADSVQCRCGHQAKRRFHVSINRSSLRQSARWDPVVGAYVNNDREFRSLLAQGQDAQSEKLGMDCKLQTVDARDTDALASLHGHDASERKEQAEKTAFHKKAM